MSDIKKKAGEFIQRQFSTGNFKQAELAKELGIAKSSVNHWVLGITVPEPIYYDAIANFFNVSLLEVIGIADVTQLNDEDKELLEKYHSASEDNKRSVRIILNFKDIK